MSSNGVEQIWAYAIPEELSNVFLDDNVERSLAALSIKNSLATTPPSPQQVDTLLWQIEELCSGQHGANFNGVYTRQLPSINPRKEKPLQLAWNAAGTVGGFGFNSTWDGALASVENVSVNSRRWRAIGALLGKPESIDNLYVPHGNPQKPPMPIIRTTLWRPSGPTFTDRRASTSEVEAISTVLHNFIVPDAPQARHEQNKERPIFLEIGFGIDPAVFRGNRQYHTKSYLGVDPGVGEYENPLGDYSDAVRTSADIFAEDAKSTRPYEHIQFVIGDAQHLDLPPRSVREVFMSNVVNAPIDGTVRSNILQEANRVIERNGTLVVRVNWHQDLWPSQPMTQELQDHGFAVVRSVQHTDPEYHQLETQYGTPSQVPAPQGYYLIATVNVR